MAVSALHEGLLLLFRNRPTLAPDLMRTSLKVELPHFTEARIQSGELTKIVPVESRADLVVLLLDGKPVHAIIVEVQLARDDDKLYSWPDYLTSLRSRLRCPVSLLVVTPDAPVARWAAQPIATGHARFDLYPFVLGPDAVPFIAEPSQVAADPELAVLSVMAHGGDSTTAPVIAAILGAVDGLEPERSKVYADLVYRALGPALRAAVEKLMLAGYEYQSDFARKYYGEGIEKGIEKGIEEGQLRGEANSLLKVLDARGIKVDAEVKSRIESCEDSAKLQSWLVRAVTAKSAADLFKSTRKPSGRRSPRKQ